MFNSGPREIGIFDKPLSKKDAFNGFANVFPTFERLFFVKHPAFRIPVAVLLALLLLFGGTAKEFVHQFTGHTDTVHDSCTSSCAETKDGLAFGPKHHHCDFLQFTLAAFETPSVFNFHGAELLPKHAVRHLAVPQHLWLIRCFSALTGRGPPAVHAA